MSEKCLTCEHRRPADRASIDQLSTRGMAPSQQAAANRLAGELRAACRLEQLAYERTAGGGTLRRRPLEHDWCFARLAPDAGQYYFCDWLETMECADYSGPDASHPMRSDSKKRPVKTRAERQSRNDTTVDDSLGDSPEPAPAVHTTVAPAGGARSASVPMPAPPSPVSAHAIEVDGKEEWSLSLGAAFDLRTVSRPPAPGRSLGAGSFTIDYEMFETAERPAIRGKGLAQTYLIFGGPGAGKTTYFKYLLSSLLAEPRKPGCLLLDPKGALTEWLEGVLKKLGRAGDLMVLKEDASQNAFNVLGNRKDLPPLELGRLLTEVVLAGASGLEVGWAVLVGDLLESAAVVISVDADTAKPSDPPKPPLTAKRLLHEILYPVRFEKLPPDGLPGMRYPIVITADRVLKRTSDPDALIACDRIHDFFRTVDDSRRRFVRQIIERSLGSLMSSRWAYLSSDKNEDSVYSGIMRNHRIVTVAAGQSSPAFQRSLSTLVKALFQQSALADLSKYPKDRPFFILACDEYAQAITEGETGLVSDSRFFSLSREAGCMSLLALQSVATGRSRFPASMYDRWEAVLGNVTVKLFMRVNDTATAELGSRLAGTQHSFVPVASQQLSAQGLSATEAVTVLEHPRVPPWYLTNRMPQGYAFVHGTLDGESMPTTVFVRGPAP